MRLLSIRFSRGLRKSQTAAEKKLWLLLRNRQLCNTKFRRQHPAGKYILDFYSPAYKIGIEADGGQHYEDRGIKTDERRTQELSKAGIKLLRFSDRDILTNIEGVYQVIAEAIAVLQIQGK